MNFNNIDTNKLKKNEYENTAIVNSYREDVIRIGLWESEMLLYNKYLNKEDVILDLGCGAGRTTFSLYELGYKRLTGLDCSSHMIQVCNEIASERKVNINFIVGDACKLPFKDREFDKCIFSFNGLTTIPGRYSRRKALLEINRILKENGIFIFTTHDIKNSKYKKFWELEKIKWTNNLQDKRLTEFGDIIYTTEIDGEKIEGFTHIPSYEEIIDDLKFSNFKLMYASTDESTDKMNKLIRETSNGCIFWVARK